ncbi:hypothetical protein ACF0H5_017379 [Mactra antiquata]
MAASWWCCCCALQSIWKIDHNFDDMISYDFQLENVQTVSVIQCAEKCFTNKQCASFFYTRGIRSCLMNSQKINETVVTESNLNTQLYFLKDEGMWHNTTCQNYKSLPNMDKSLKILQHGSVNWTTAYLECQRNGGRLAILKTDAELDLAMHFIAREFGITADQSGFWVSARYNGVIDDFVWTDDNSTIVSSQWHPGDPKGLHEVPFVDQCVIMVPNNNKLNNDKCGLSFKSIYPLCECTW